MPRKNIPKKSAISGKPALPRFTKPTARKKPIHQCINCGGLVDPIYGLGFGSWCPHCRKSGDIIWADGEIPVPDLYGSWVEEQEAKLADTNGSGQSVAPISIPVTSSALHPAIPPTNRGISTMKITQTHNGLYSCHNCCIEYELSGEASLKCENCGGLLLQGNLEDCDDDEDDDEG